MRNEKKYDCRFLAILSGIVLIGALLGTISCCCLDADIVKRFGLTGMDFITGRKNMEFGKMLVSSLGSTTVFLLVIFVLGFSSIGQPAEIAVLVIRGIGLGVTLSQIYISGGKTSVLWGSLLVVPCATISTYAIITGAREALTMSNIYLKISLSDRQENGLLCSLKLYAVKFLVLEAVLAVGAGVDCLCTYLFLNKI